MNGDQSGPQPSAAEAFVACCSIVFKLARVPRRHGARRADSGVYRSADLCNVPTEGPQAAVGTFPTWGGGMGTIPIGFFGASIGLLYRQN
jgi:hypothetical protein